MELGPAFVVFQFAAFIFSVVVHEVSHGYVAERLGDPTARLLGRLTLNPLKHIDPFGSVLLPIMLAMMNLPVIGWAKPVPYNPLMLKNPRMAAGKISAAGPASNFLLAVVFAVFLRVLPGFGVRSAPLALSFSLIIYINVLLAVFNLVPIPPLDGSKVLFALLPHTPQSHELALFLDRYGIFLLLLFIFFGFGAITPVIHGIASFLIGGGYAGGLW